MYVAHVDMNMIRQQAIRIMALNREQPLRIFRMTGLARFVVWVRIPLSRKQSKVCL